MKDKVEIITNRVPRPILSAWELTDKQWKKLGYDDDEKARSEQDGDSFVLYKGYPYLLNDFMRVDFHREDCPFGRFWHGYSSDTFFSGVLMHICEDGDSVIMGRYFS